MKNTLINGLKYYLTGVALMVLFSPVLAATLFVVGAVGKALWYCLKFGFNLY